MEWSKLSEYKENIYRGAFIKFPAKYPFEDEVVMMVCDNIANIDFPFSLITITGYKAGICPFQNLPKESLSIDTHSIKIQWMVENWDKWIYDECGVSDVYIKGIVHIGDVL